MCKHENKQASFAGFKSVTSSALLILDFIDTCSSLSVMSRDGRAHGFTSTLLFGAIEATNTGDTSSDSARARFLLRRPLTAPTPFRMLFLFVRKSPHSSHSTAARTSTPSSGGLSLQICGSTEFRSWRRGFFSCLRTRSRENKAGSPFQFSNVDAWFV